MQGYANGRDRTDLLRVEDVLHLPLAALHLPLDLLPLGEDALEHRGQHAGPVLSEVVRLARSDLYLEDVGILPVGASGVRDIRAVALRASQRTDERYGGCSYEDIYKTDKNLKILKTDWACSSRTQAYLP